MLDTGLLNSEIWVSLVHLGTKYSSNVEAILRMRCASVFPGAEMPAMKGRAGKKREILKVIKHNFLWSKLERTKKKVID